MSANTTPIFTLTPNCQVVTISAANTASDGSGTLVTLFSAGLNGSRLDSIVFKNAQITPAASSAMVGRVFLTDSAGANPRLIEEVAIPAATRTASAVGATSTITFSNGLVISSGQIVKVITSVYAGPQDLFHVIAKGGDY